MQPTLTEQVVGQLLEYIQKERLAGGEELPTESELMDLLGVSRGALREALSQLKALGIVTSRRGSGFRVKDPDIIDALSGVIRHLARSGSDGLRRLYKSHRFLELGCIGDAVVKATEEERLRVERARANYEEIARSAHFLPVDIDLAEMEFHMALTAPADYASLRTVNEILYEFFRTRAVEQFPDGYSPEKLARNTLEHNAISAAYQLNLPEAVYFALRRHLEWGLTL